MKISKSEFIKIFAGQFWSKLGNSFIPIPKNLHPIKNDFLSNLYDDIKNKNTTLICHEVTLSQINIIGFRESFLFLTIEIVALIFSALINWKTQ